MYEYTLYSVKCVHYTKHSNRYAKQNRKLEDANIEKLLAVKPYKVLYKIVWIWKIMIYSKLSAREDMIRSMTQ